MPNKRNIYLYSFGVALTGLIVLVIVGEKLPAEITNDFLIPTIILTCVFGILTLIPNLAGLVPPAPAKGQRAAHQSASRFLKDSLDKLRRVPPTYIRELPLGKKAKVIQVEKVAGEKLLNDLLDGTPAVALPQSPDPNLILDWYKYHLCIIAAAEDLEFAGSIRDELHRLDRNLRIYLDPDNMEKVGEFENPYLKRVFYSGSLLCLVLISKHFCKDEFRKRELNTALQHVYAFPQIESHEPYLMPIPLDEQGRAYMKQDDDLKQYMKDVIKEPTGRLRAIVNTIWKRWINSNVFAPARTKVFISYSRLDQSWLDRLLKRLRPRIPDPDQNIWYDRVGIRPTSFWKEEIKMALDSSKLVVVLVSPAYIRSKAIRSFEYPLILDVLKYGVKMGWVHLSKCGYDKLVLLKEILAFHDIKKPLSPMNHDEQEEELDNISDRIVEAYHGP